jgi:hypothetical protein
VLYPGSTPVGNATLVVANVLTCNKHSQCAEALLLKCLVMIKTWCFEAGSRLVQGLRWTSTDIYHSHLHWHNPHKLNQGHRQLTTQPSFAPVD